MNKVANTYAMEKRYFHKDGRVIWVLLTVAIVWNTDETPLYFISQLKDITERKKNADRLHKERQRLNNVIESTQIGTWEWNIITGKRTNDERCYTMLGYNKSELEPHQLSDIYKGIHPEDEPKAQALMDECLSGETDLYHSEYRMKAKDGSWVWMESHGKVIRWSEDGKPMVMLGTRQDITKRKLVEVERLKTMEIISDQNKRLINFAHIVSHNLRSHAGNFQMMLELYKLENDEDEKKHMIDLLMQNAENLTETIANLNEVVSFQFDNNKQTKLIKLDEQIRKTIVNIQALVEQENASFSIFVDPDLHVNYNPAYLESILLNFFTNAVKYKHPNRLPEVIVSAFVEDGHTIIEIKDNGIGIDLELHGNKLFGMYKTFHNHADARGIGLFITKNQVEAMGGTIKVFSEVGVGTTFKIFI
ncbi:MAG: PAS domain S-box protein [Pedobacter sp.]|nr:MAG: PAS domain S-box protein [Pedobacter sp.]